MRVAMRCSQEQYDAIKDKLVGCELVGIGNFVTYDYLINYRFGNKNHITNYMYSAVMNDKAEIYNEWDEKIFLEACGIETEKIFKGSELQYKSSMDIEWQKFPENWDIRFKPDYSKEIAELERQIKELKNR